MSITTGLSRDEKNDGYSDCYGTHYIEARNGGDAESRSVTYCGGYGYAYGSGYGYTYGGWDGSGHGHEVCDPYLSLFIEDRI
jgi:hypothetical protein